MGLGCQEPHAPSNCIEQPSSPGVLIRSITHISSPSNSPCQTWQRFIDITNPHPTEPRAPGTDRPHTHFYSLVFSG